MQLNQNKLLVTYLLLDVGKQRMRLHALQIHHQPRILQGGGGSWLKLPAGKVGDLGFEPRSGIQVSKKQNISALLTRKD